jgi:hypothetical protein
LRKVLLRLLRQSPAMVVAMLALFVALTGTAVATTSALITGNQIRNSSITGLDVKNKSLTPRDFRGSVRGPRGLRGLTGATGATGPKGDKGDKGDTGASGATNVVVRTGAVTVLPENSNTTATASCQPGERATGGGWFMPPGTSSIETHVRDFGPTPETGTPTGWQALVLNQAGGQTTNQNIQIFVVCAAP